MAVADLRWSYIEGGRQMRPEDYESWDVAGEEEADGEID